jgi:hypothetical protein
MAMWQQAASAAGFDVDALTSVAELVARKVVDIDGPPIEELPGYWVIPGFLPYDGHTILATVDRTHMHGAADAGRELSAIVARAVVDALPV